jgi:hypothetical protein
VDSADRGRDPGGVVVRTEDERGRRVERRPEARQWIGLEVAVLGHGLCHRRMGQLHQQRPATSDHERAFAAQAPDHGIVSEQRRHRLDRTAGRTRG